jgi:outer membrane protein OmpA-like peptidoglycan-associated protein
MKRFLLGLLVPGVAAASPGFEVGGAIGGHAFSSDVELGVDDRMDEPGPAAGALLGLRLGVQLSRRLAIEGEAMAIATEDDVLGDRATVYGLRTHARFDLLTGRLRPFVVAGLGMHVLRASSPQMDDDVDQAYHWGFGARYAISPRLDVRLDLRHLIVPDRSQDGATSDVEVTAGVTYRLGVRTPRPLVVRPAVPPPAPPPRREGDADHDGIADIADSCPIDPETPNGWQDFDGCPDQVIAELTGIGFENDSAKIDSASGSILDLAYLILKDNPALVVEISGHTSSEGLAEYNLELSLRRAQAVKAYLVKRGIEATRLLTIGHGADVPIADNKTDEGRRKNRRIEFRILRSDERR